MTTVEVVPYGVITTRHGGEYFLLAPEPVDSEDWMHPEQQKFLVVPTWEGRSQTIFYKKHYLITTNPDIHLFVANTTKRVTILSRDDNEKIV